MGIRFPGTWVVLAVITSWTAMAMAVFVLSGEGGGRMSEAATDRAGPPAARPSHPPLWYDERTFFDAVREGEAPPVPDGTYAGAIIPHDWAGGHLITALIRGLSAHTDPTTVVLIGPDHSNAGSARALTSDLAWLTPFGLVEPDEQRIRVLEEAGLVEVESDVLTGEHSVAGIMPAIKYYLPDARVVPIILSGDFSPTEARRLAGALSRQWEPGTVIIASVDFSHELVRAEAERRDALTLEALRAFDAATLFTLDNKHLDSPASMAVLMGTMADLDAVEFVLVENTNSGALMDDQLLPTTSYIAGYYRQRGTGDTSQDAAGR